MGANDPYTEYAGQNIIKAENKDRFGNVRGNQYDLSKDGAFSGFKIAVLHLYTGEGFDFELPTLALREKGFGVHRWKDAAPPVAEFAAVLETCCQLWVISSNTQLITNEHIDIIESFFNQGRGVYIWGDNDPYYTDANRILKRLFNCSLAGNSPGNQVLTLQTSRGTRGFSPNHQITTGLEFLYEGITIASIKPESAMQPLIFGSGNSMIAGIYDKDGKRAIADGGFTRLFCQWDTAGTGRYVKNAAAWLTNYHKLYKTEGGILKGTLIIKGDEKPVENKTASLKGKLLK
ncbi:hypothetical protein LX99_05011 [Mucilaginibacter oryzae]|uniref:Uncharacterized protein n=1 Tax=Mucilaginibacter oryzae TaxID=468058 RepID=A0A316GTM7_9SPHI|nr:hypothetical protein [Mucilaginibacter oryzae]PWK65778.1 hypothetical protein LX99_05011 [Mucilaginibacter oryzae]